MNTLDDIFNIAKQRAIAKNLSYEGELTPQEAFNILQAEPGAVLVDVRSRAELNASCGVSSPS